MDYFTCSEINGRDNNEDSFLVCQITPAPGEIPLTILAVADGMGGYEPGEDVSREALKKISLLLFELLVLELGINCQNGKEKTVATREDLGDALREAIAQTNAYIKRMVKNNNWHNSGSTLAIVLISPPEAIIANLGDSPIFHYSRGKLRQISDDHTVAKALMRGGMISSQMAEHHEGKNMLELYLGCDKLPPELPVHYASLNSGDLLLLCSDGVTGKITWKQLKNSLAGDSLKEVGMELINIGREAGETDNQTLILWRYLGESAGYETMIQ
jgi:protein phosphatase